MSLDLHIQPGSGENDEDQHEIRMTDDPHYREWYRKEQRRKEIEEHGIDED